MQIGNVIKAMEKSRLPIQSLRIPRRSGVYAFYLKHCSSIKDYNVSYDKPIYIGSAANLAAKGLEQHLNSDNTGFSSIRCTLGAIFKIDFKLKAIQRGSSLSASNFESYRFIKHGEKLITAWIMENLEVAIYPIFENYKNAGKLLISELQPILNLTGWKNPYAKRIRGLRKVCVDEARNRAI